MAEVVLIAGGIGFVVGFLQDKIRQWWRARKTFSLSEWMDAVDPDRDWRREIMDAIYAEHDRKIDEPVRDLVWVMSREWYLDIRAMFPPPGYSSLNAGSWKDAADRVLSETLIGIPVEIRDDAGFPALVRREEDE